MIRGEDTMEEELKGLPCPYCKTTDPAIRYRFEDCAIVRCRACELMWLHPKPDPAKLHEVYDEGYYRNCDLLDGDNTKIYGYVDYIAERMNKQYQYKKIVDKVKGMLNHDGTDSDDFDRSWLDVGCGLAFLMDVAFDSGFSVQGIEFNSAAVDYIRSKYTFPVTLGALDEVDFTRKYDVISMMDVIEHLTDPIGDLAKLREVITDDGYLLVYTMDSDSFTSRLLGKRLEDFRRVREHLFFFSRRSISNVLNCCGWEVCEIQSLGHTFELNFLIDRIGLISPLASGALKAVIYPKWLLDANIYINPRTKMLVYARPKA